MKKHLKTAGIITAALLIVIYAAFLFVLPNIVDLNKYMPEIKKMAFEQAGLVVDINNPKIVTTPLLAAGLKADGVSVKLADNSELLKTDKIIARISLPHLIFLTVKVSNAEIENPQINIDILDGKEYKIVKTIEEAVKKQENQTPVQSAQDAAIDMSLIKISVPKVKITDYNVLINDLKTKNYLKLRGDELVLGYKNGKSAKIKTLAEFFVNETKNITANIDIDTFLPEIAASEPAEPAQTKEIPFINPVAVYMAYDLKTNIDSKIKIRQKNKKIVSNGYFNIDNLTLNIGGIHLPESWLHLTTKENLYNIESNVAFTDNEKISVEGLFNNSKKPLLQMKIRSDEIHLDNVLNLAEAALNSANIKNGLDSFKGEGYFKANTEFKTNFKKLTSEGNITIYNCIVRNIKDNKRLARVNSVISLDNSMLQFIDTYIEILDAVFKIDGTIDKTSKADISMYMEKMPVQKLFALFVPSEISKDYDINSGNIDLTAKLDGELKNASADVNLSVSNLSLTDKVNNINYLNNLFTADISSDFKTYNGKINNSDFKLTMNGVSVDCDKFSALVDEKNISIAPSAIRINNSTVINLSGDVKDYSDKPEFKINADGDLIAQDIKRLLGSDLAVYIKEKGKLPFIASLAGDSKLQTIKIAVDANKDNYITFADIDSLLNKDTVIQAVIDLKGDSLKIKETGLFIKNASGLEDVISIDGTVTKLDTSSPSINLIKLKIPKDLIASLAVFPQSKLTVKGSAFVSGDLYQPKLKGDFNISNMSVPELFLTVKNAVAKFEGKDLDVDIAGVNANGSDFDILINADLTPSSDFVIKNLNLISNFIDADKLMKVSDAAIKYTMPSPSSSSVSGAVNGSSGNSSDIPVIVKDGSIDIKQIKSGNIILNDTTGKISLNNNIFYLNNLVTTGFKGRISGNVSMNLVSGEIKANVKGNGLNVEQTLLEAAAMKDTLSGTMDFDANLSLKGSTYEEQVQTLKGDVNFTMKDGGLGPIGKLENLIAADNIRSNVLLNTVVGSALKSTVDTSKYNTIKGHLAFNNGIAQINPVTSAGDYMSTYIFGNFNILKNTADMKLRGKLSPKAADSLGQLAAINPVNVVKSASGMNIVLGKLLLKMCEKVTSDEIAQIPALSKDNANTENLNFQVVIRGDAAQPAKLIRSFKWLASESEIKEAEDALAASATLSVPTNINEVKQQAKDLMKSILPAQPQEGSSSGTASLKEQLKQTQKNVWQQLKEQAKQTVIESSPAE